MKSKIKIMSLVFLMNIVMASTDNATDTQEDNSGALFSNNAKDVINDIKALITATKALVDSPNSNGMLGNNADDVYKAAEKVAQALKNINKLTKSDIKQIKELLTAFEEALKVGIDLDAKIDVLKQGFGDVAGQIKQEKHVSFKVIQAGAKGLTESFDAAKSFSSESLPRLQLVLNQIQALLAEKENNSGALAAAANS